MSGGLFRVARGGGPIAAAARAAGWRWHDLDLRAPGVDPLSAAAASLPLPTWFGGNWDALADCLADPGLLGGGGARGDVVHVLGPAARPRDGWGPAETLLDVLRDAAAERASAGPPLLALVRGPLGRGLPPWTALRP